LHWIERAEANIRTDSLSDLIEIVENLFYTLYARIVLEMAAMELCANFKTEPRQCLDRRKFYLPNPAHLYHIFVSIKDVLDSPAICEGLHESVLCAYQEIHLRNVADQNADKEYNLDDPIGYHRYVLEIVSDRNSRFVQKWATLLPFFSDIPAELMIAISENYLTVEPQVELQSDVPADQLPFNDLKTTQYNMWVKELTEDYRVASLASLEGRMLGEYRRDEGKPLLTLAKQHKCICISLCRCAGECTVCLELPCPCYERQLRILLAQNRRGPGEFDFATRANTLARALFEKLAFLKLSIRHDQLLSQLDEVMEGFELEILKERSSGLSGSWT
jgi:hypothetical protein